jgi:hypothetical protein
LEDLILRNSLDACQKLREVRNILASRHSVTLNLLEASLKNFAFDDALYQLNILKKSCC